MRTIDILTTQNVTINYEIAEVRDRIFAFIIDALVLTVGLVILTRLLMGSGLFSNTEYIMYFIIFPILFFYHFAFEVLMDGQSPGKKMLGIKVVKLTGTEPSLNDYLIRWAFRPLDIFFSLGSIGIMLISSSEKGQRLGDIVANTTVIKTNPTQRIVLTDILNIRSIENYVPVYPNAREFSEQEMLMLKEIIDRNAKYQNDAHIDALNDAVDAVCVRLNLQKAPLDKIGFIKTLIKDFVALSR